MSNKLQKLASEYIKDMSEEIAEQLSLAAYSSTHSPAQKEEILKEAIKKFYIFTNWVDAVLDSDSSCQE